jgi:electron transfer flavoprotein beta subunit
LTRKSEVKIAVCIKRVPDTEMRFAIAANRTSIDPAGLKFDLSDFDGYAVEVALRLVEKHPPGEVVAVTLGPDPAQETLRKALSMGVDRGFDL